MSQPSSHRGRPALPSLASSERAGRTFYVVCDPAVLSPGQSVLPDMNIAGGGLRYLAQTSGGLGAGVAVAFALLALSTTGVAFLVVATLAGFFAGALIGLVVCLVKSSLDYAAAVRRSRDRMSCIDMASRRAWDMCGLVTDIASTAAWQNSLVDRDRLVPGLLWRYVRAAEQLDALERDVAQAQRHDSLLELVELKQADLAERQQALDGIRDRLTRVLGAARDLDRREQDHRRLADQQREADELRRRLATTHAPPVRQDEWSAAAIQAEAEVLNELLAESDRMIPRS